MTRGRSIAAIVIGAAMILIVVVMAIPGLSMFKYRPFAGTVLSTRIDSTVSGRINIHRPVIAYQYQVNGILYKNDTFDPFNGEGTRTWAESILRQYSIGGACTVFADPSSPQDSVLSRTPNNRAVWIFIGFSILGSCILTSGIAFLRSQRAH
jgi:hypothetical protein